MEEASQSRETERWRKGKGFKQGQGSVLHCGRQDGARGPGTAGRVSRKNGLDVGLESREGT